MDCHLITAGPAQRAVPAAIHSAVAQPGLLFAQPAGAAAAQQLAGKAGAADGPAQGSHGQVGWAHVAHIVASNSYGTASACSSQLHS